MTRTTKRFSHPMDNGNMRKLAYLREHNTGGFATVDLVKAARATNTTPRAWVEWLSKSRVIATAAVLRGATVNVTFQVPLPNEERLSQGANYVRKLNGLEGVWGPRQRRVPVTPSLVPAATTLAPAPALTVPHDTIDIHISRSLVLRAALLLFAVIVFVGGLVSGIAVS